MNAQNRITKTTTKCLYPLIRIVYLKLGMVVLTWDPSIWEVKTGVSAVEGKPQLQRKFKANLGNVRFYVKKTNKQMKKNNRSGLPVYISLT